MKRPDISLSEEPGTLPLGGSDPTHALPGATGPRLVLGRYRLERRLGAGGFGVVWLGWDEKLEREVAVKAIPREDGSGERVEREARAAARLNHPGIVAVYELSWDEHDVYLVSELVRGRTLAELVRAGAIADRDVARIGVALCDALDHAHARGVIHRDVKPQNVMVVADPAAGAGFAKLADFGVAHVVSDSPLTHTGDVVGTLAYMAPEQAEGRGVGPASDVYSLALTLYEAWTGTNPVRGGGPAGDRAPGRPPAALAVGDAPRPPARALRRDRRRARGRPRPAPLAAAAARAAGRRRERARRRGRAGRAGDAAPGRAAAHRVGAAPSRGCCAGPRPEPRRCRPPPPAAPADLQRRRRARAGAARAAGHDRLALRGDHRRARRRPLAGGIVLGVLEGLGPEPTFSAAAAAGAAALAVALLPRIAWLMVAAGLCGWLISPEADRQGTALILAAAAAPMPLLLPRAGLLWSVPILAPLLGAVAIGPAFVGVAALAHRLAPRRPRRGRLPLAGARRGAHRQGPPVRHTRRGAPARGVGGVDQRGRLRRARAAAVRAVAGARGGLGRLRDAAAAGGARPLAGRWTWSAPDSGRPA